MISEEKSGPEIPVATTERNRSGLFITECPYCLLMHRLMDDQLGLALACPITGRLLKVHQEVGSKNNKKDSSEIDSNSKQGFPAIPSPKQENLQIEQTSLSDISGELADKEASDPSLIPKKFHPETIKAYLDRYIIGQEQAKLETSTALYYHLLAFQHGSNKGKRSLSSLGPILLAGPTGCGKTFLIETACRYTNMPFVHVNTAAMVSEGIVGISIGDIAKEALHCSDQEVKKAEYSVVFLDEFDKTLNNQTYGKGVMSQLLRVMEGTDLRFGSGSDMKILNTRHMLFFVGGAFQDVFSKFERKSMGYLGGDGQKKNRLTVRAIRKEMEKKGIPRELLGRIRSTLVMDSLREDELLKIMSDSLGSPLKKYQDMVEAHGDRLDIEPEALLMVAGAAAASGIGARALEEILYRIFQPILYIAPRQEKTSFFITLQEVEMILRKGESL